MTETYPYKISVIIPVYKVEDYLQRCVESVLNQSMGGLEIILVDDGSPDNCPKICDEYADKYENIFTFHKTNGGLSSARNVGIKNAHGKYLFFLDSDDWLDPDGLERLYKVAEETGVDFVRYRSIRTGWPGLPENTPTRVEEPREMTGGFYSLERIQKEIYPRLFATSQLTLGPIVGACSSLYKASLLFSNNILFDETIKYSEDIPFSAQVVLNSKSFYFVDEAGTYHYWYNRNSISKSFKKDRWDSCKQIIKKCEILIGDNEHLKKELNWIRWFCILLALNERKYITGKQQKKAYCEKILKDSELTKAYIIGSGMQLSLKQWAIITAVKLHLGTLISRL